MTRFCTASGTRSPRINGLLKTYPRKLPGFMSMGIGNLVLAYCFQGDDGSPSFLSPKGENTLLNLQLRDQRV